MIYLDSAATTLRKPPSVARACAYAIDHLATPGRGGHRPAMLAAQTILMYFYARFVVYNIMGRDYEAAVMTAAFCGFGMGATPNAMANMQAVTKRYGPAPQAFFVVPLVGSLFIDFFNGLIITGFLNILPIFG